MQNKAKSNQKKAPYANQIESLKDLGRGAVRDLGKVAALDKLLGQWEDEEVYEQPRQTEKKPVSGPRQEFTIFSHSEHAENQKVREEVMKLTEEVKHQVKAVEKAGSELAGKAREAGKVVTSTLPEKPGVYHIRFLETIVEFLRTLTLKIGESNTWLEAMMSKKKKRGSLFAARSKKMGTQYSLSAELQTSRAVQ